MFGDIGHLPYSRSTFSQHHGYNWWNIGWNS
jgi:hypothetical protein